jgi:hypothetical protein
VGTVSQYTQRGNDNRHQRGERMERAEWFAQDVALKAQGTSQRQAAQVLEVPRSTLQAWRAYQERRDECPAVVAFFHSPPGLAFLPRLVLAIHLVWTEVGACGIRLGCLLLKLTGLHRFVGASYGTQQQVNRRVEEALVAYRHEERARLAHKMPPKEITLTPDEPFTGGLCLVGIEPVSTSIVLEPLASARDHDPWPAHMEQARSELNGQVIQSTSNDAPGLLAYVEHHLGAHPSPDVFHVQHELSKAVSARVAAKQRAAEKAATQAEEMLKRVQEQLHSANNEPDQCGSDRFPKGTARLAQVEQDVKTARQEQHRLAGQREQVTQSRRALGHADHGVDLERGGRRNGKLIARDLHEQIDTIRAIAQQEHLSETGLDRIEKAERVVPKMQATIECVSGYGRQQVRQRDLVQTEASAMHAHLIPSYSLERVAATRTVAQSEPLRALAERIRTPRSLRPVGR